MAIVMINGKNFEFQDSKVLGGQKVLMNNYGDKASPNKYVVSVPSWKELSAQNQRDIQIKAMFNGLDISAAGYEYTITTLTQIKAKAIRQTFYEVAPSDFMPVVTGEGAFMTNLVYNNVYSNADAFETGNIGSAMPFGKVPTVNAQIIAKAAVIQPWAKGVNYNVFQLAQAAHGNVNLLEELEFGRKKNYDLGIQGVAFQGSSTVAGIKGLYNGESVYVDIATITDPISGLSADDFQKFVAAILGIYSTNVNGTVMPDTFVMPLADWLGMGSSASSSYPLTSKLEYLEKAFKMVSQNPNFKITTTKYGDTAQMTTLGSAYPRYILYRNQVDTLELNIPMPYITTTFGTANGWDFENVSYAQYAGVYIKHPQEVVYFDQH